ncbi:hypothetical protein [Methylobacterium gossipiicola]|uniref:Uncharacterized protein n=1 Tax=Methylobacterium gossipiicola TaxID=582675 RepID=A0A1I2VTQ0_9HYPH|nr:hypothetical protein [Methylobacterium gossipiicola]SFG92624.1 hypothetical protein SAMN05192565_11775 [Methylobacterium gossipiicola]
MAPKLMGPPSAQASTRPVYYCACGCGAYASRGFPNDIWYATAHVPPTMRFPWERGYEPPPAEAPVPPRETVPDSPFLPGLSPR